jgi:hypothetical protein
METGIRGFELAHHDVVDLAVVPNREMIDERHAASALYKSTNELALVRNEHPGRSNTFVRQGLENGGTKR